MHIVVAIMFALAIVVPLGLTIWLLIHAARQATSMVDSCRRCGYDLRGLRDTRRCPECGQPFAVNEKGHVIS